MFKSKKYQYKHKKFIDYVLIFLKACLVLLKKHTFMIFKAKKHITFKKKIVFCNIV